MNTNNYDPVFYLNQMNSTIIKLFLKLYNVPCQLNDQITYFELSLVSKQKCYLKREYKVRMNPKLSRNHSLKNIDWSKRSKQIQQSAVDYEWTGLLQRKSSIQTKTKSSLWHKNQNKKLLIQNQQKLFTNQQAAQMNQLYEENQKLGYRINYLNDQNNFYRISINNIQKLNNKIKKDLDANQIQTKNKTNINKVQTNINQVQKNINQIQINKKMNTYQRKGSNNNLHVGNPSTTWNPMLSSEDKQREQWLNGGWKGSSLKLISNKIHLKNLQIKVGNSIRQTQKLKRIYQGSLTSLTKKTQDLEDEINKMARQCEYYMVEADLLNNIYKADFYFNFHSDWLSLGKPEPSQQKTNNPNTNHFLYKSQNKYEAENPLIQQSQYSFKFNQPLKIQYQIKSLQFHQKNTETNSKYLSINKQSHLAERKKLTNKDILGFGDINQQNYPMAVRFLSFSYKHNRIGKTHGWYSTMYPKSKVNKLLQMIQTRSNNQLPTNRHYNKIGDSGKYEESLECRATNIHMSEKQLFLLPQSLVKFVLNSIEKQQIQQNNNLQSLRKQQKQQRKNQLQLTQKIEELNEKKRQLKQRVDEQFSQFFVKNIQRLDIISSSNNNTHAINKGTKPNQKGRQLSRMPGLSSHKKSSINLTNANLRDINKGRDIGFQGTKVSNSIKQRKQEADQLLICSLYQKQLIQQISRRQLQLEEQFRINQEYKQRIVDRNQQEAKEIKVLEEEVSKCHEQLNQLRMNYKLVTQNKNNQTNQLNNVNQGDQLLI